MDLSDVAVRHAVAFTTLDTRHPVDLSPSTLAFVKEIRCCVIAIVTGATIASIVRSVSSWSRGVHRIRLYQRHNKRSFQPPAFVWSFAVLIATRQYHRAVHHHYDSTAPTARARLPSTLLARQGRL